MRIAYDEYGCSIEFDGEIEAVHQSSQVGAWSGIGFSDVTLGAHGRVSMVQHGVQIGLSLKPRRQSYLCAGATYDFTDDNIMVLEPKASVVGSWAGPFRNLTLKIAPEAVERISDVAITRVRIRNQFAASQSNTVVGPLLLAVSADLGAGCPNGPILVESVAATLLLICAGPDKASSRSAPTLKSSQAAILRDLIAAHVQEPLSLQQLADSVGISVGHLVRAFKASFGLTPYQYILRERVNRVLILIEGGQTSLADAARQAGFRDAGQMSKTFRRLTGRTPRDAARDARACPPAGTGGNEPNGPVTERP